MLIDLLPMLPSLDCLNLNFCGLVGDTGLARLPSSVRSLSIIGCAHVSHALLQRFDRSLSALLCDDSFVDQRHTGNGAEADLNALMRAYYREMV